MPSKAMADQKPHTAVAIVGGGMVGMALALSLALNKISSVLIESSDIKNDEDEQFDDRTLVINPASQVFWKKIGLWSAIEAHTTCINTVHVSNQGRFGVVHFDKDELNVSQLGHVIAAKKLASLLLDHVKQSNYIQCIQPAKLLGFEQSKDQVTLTVENDNSQMQLSAQLMVGADGVQSSIRKQLKLETSVKSYQRKAIICNITTDQKHNNRAFERLTREGPMALLPFTNEEGQNRFGFVWSMNQTDADQLLHADDDAYLKLAQQRFGYRAGVFQKLGRRSQYPLFQIKVPVQYADRVVLMGNAAHAVSPVSAQGLNLAVRGIDRLTQVLTSYHHKDKDLGQLEVLKTYQQASKDDQSRTLNYTDDLMTWFKIDETIVNAIRSLGMVAINANATLKQNLYNTAGGLK